MNSVQSYIEQFNPEIQERLEQIRELFLQFNPTIEESIRYNMPSYKIGGGYLYFAAYKNHIGFYPTYGLTELEAEMEAYRAVKTKDSLHFKHKESLPLDLIRKIIEAKSIS